MTTPEQDPRLAPEQRDELDFEESWATFLRSRESLREVMSDDELREWGINLAEYDRKPEAGDFR